MQDDKSRLSLATTHILRLLPAKSRDATLYIIIDGCNDGDFFHSKRAKETPQVRG